jgi:hypothetical protein
MLSVRNESTLNVWCASLETTTINPPQATQGGASTVIIAAAAGAGGAVVLIIIIITVVLLFRRRRRQSQVMLASPSSSQYYGKSSTARGIAKQMGLLVHEKVEKTFLLAFAGQFSKEELDTACGLFAMLETPRKNVKLDRLIGQGQSGEVYAARLTGVLALTANSNGVTLAKDGLRVAVKQQRRSENTLKSASVLQTSDEEGLQLEARLLYQLQHPHIVRVVATVMTSLPSFICFEFMANGDLKTYLRFSVLKLG